VQVTLAHAGGIALGDQPAWSPSRAGRRAVGCLEQAKERLVLARATHLDSLAAALAQPRVRQVIEPVLAGTLNQLDPYNDDIQYASDLGLIAPKPPLRIANPIYREVIVQVLAANVEFKIVADPRSFILGDGRLDIDLLLHEFAVFWREHADVLTAGVAYHEAPHSWCSWATCSTSSTAAATSTGSTAPVAAASTCSSAGPTRLQPARKLCNGAPSN
jgi:hypothetical protein